jgi:hypothetical protein
VLLFVEIRQDFAGYETQADQHHQQEHYHRKLNNSGHHRHQNEEAYRQEQQHERDDPKKQQNMHINLHHLAFGNNHSGNFGLVLTIFATKQEIIAFLF